MKRSSSSSPLLFTAYAVCGCARFFSLLSQDRVFSDEREAQHDRGVEGRDLRMSYMWIDMALLTLRILFAKKTKKISPLLCYLFLFFTFYPHHQSLTHENKKNGIHESLLRTSVRAQLESATTTETRDDFWVRGGFFGDDANAESDDAVHRVQ